LARFDEQHQGQQSHHLGFTGHQGIEQPAETDRLGAKIVTDEPVAGAGDIALAEDQIDDGFDGAETVRQFGLGGHSVGNPCISDFSFGASEPLP
jgi:hypothetical protein